MDEYKYLAKYSGYREEKRGIAWNNPIREDITAEKEIEAKTEIEAIKKAVFLIDEIKSEKDADFMKLERLLKIEEVPLK